MSFVATSKVQFPIELATKVHALGLSMIPVAKTQPGLIHVAFHASEYWHKTGGRAESACRDEAVMYWEWEDEASHQACMQSQAWQQLMSSSSVLFERDDVAFEIQSYYRLR